MFREVRELEKKGDVYEPLFGSPPAEKPARESTRPAAKKRLAANSDKNDDPLRLKGRSVKVTYVKNKTTKTRNREQCDCQARDHPLFTNCTACGRIMCELEGVSLSVHVH